MKIELMMTPQLPHNMLRRLTDVSDAHAMEAAFALRRDEVLKDWS
jgi:hypothetical protein